MLSGEGDINAAVQALTTGAFGYLQKPAQQQKVVAQVRRGLDHQRTVIENRQHEAILAATIREQSSAIVSVHNEAVKTLVRASLYRDEETGTHIKRVGEFSWLIATELGWKPDLATQIRQAAPLHDVGKIGIPDAILQKPGKLTPEEMSIMRTHTTIGAAMLADSRSAMLQMAKNIALYHHERWDGEGYPNRLGREDIPVAARIVAIADVFDALSHDRTVADVNSIPKYWTYFSISCHRFSASTRLLSTMTRPTMGNKSAAIYRHLATIWKKKPRAMPLA
jgi:putative two-component system response regulator